MSAAPPSRMTTVPPIDNARPSSNFPTASSCPLDCQPRSKTASAHETLSPSPNSAVAPPCPTPHARLDEQQRDAAEPPSPTDTGHRAQHTPLRISTDFHQNASPTPVGGQQDVLFLNNINNNNNNNSSSSSSSFPPARASTSRTSTTSLHPPSRTPSVRSGLASNIASAARSSSSISSPVITALGDMTPLPSPLLSGDSPSPWTRFIDHAAPTPQTDALEHESGASSYSPPNHPVAAVRSTVASPPERKSYANLDQADNAPALSPAAQQQPRQRRHASQSAQARSVSAYQPDPAAAPKRPATVSASHAKAHPPDAFDTRLRREINYAQSRGLLSINAQPPSPPPSESSKGRRDSDSRSTDRASVFFDAYARADHKKRRWRVLRFLEQGTFSRVMLATSQLVPSSDPSVDAGPASPVDEDSLHRKKLVAVKVCEHGPRGGASEDRVEMSLKRELEIMQTVHHPSIVNLKAWNVEPTRAVLVLSYYPGGDLFGVAREHRGLLTPALTRRIFSELVGAVRHLHQMGIVHRDIKLENVLVNLTPAELANPDADWTTFRHSVVALADLGLARRVGPTEKLETRCGSDDYAAPEVIMGQSYDGRATDAWSLGVLLYALLEARLPFDPHPGMSEAHRMRSRTSHRIARVEWRWVGFAGEDGNHDASTRKFDDMGLLGAMEITEGLLRRARSRWAMDQVAAQPWVRDALRIDGGLCFWEEEQGEEV